MKITRSLLCLLIVAFAVVESMHAQQPAPNQLPTTSSQFNLSSRAKDWLARKWDANSFRDGVTLFRDRTETIGSRAAALEEINAKRGRLVPEEMRELLDEATRIAKDRTESPLLSAHATRVMANVALTLEEKNSITHEEAGKEAPFLLEVAQDPARALPLRAQAINALGLLKVSSALPVLRGLLKDAANVDKPELARPACLALWRIEGKAALAPVKEVLEATQDDSVFGSAAFTLGKSKTPIRWSLSCGILKDSRIPVPPMRRW